MSASRRTRKGSVYCLRQPERYSAETVDMMVRLLECVGPRPMRNMRPSEKHPTAADHFYADHQQQYETRGTEVGHFDAINEHNMAYPTLRDELDRKRSIARVTASEKIMATLSKRRPAKNSRKTIQKKNKQAKKSKRNNYNLNLSRIKTSKGCQYRFKRVNKGTSPDGMAIPETSEKVNANEIINLNRENSKENCTQNNSVSDLGSGYPDTTEPSLGSYHSNLSMDREPMVS